MKKISIFRQTTVLGAVAAIVPWSLLMTADITSAGSVSYTYDNLGRLSNAAYSTNVVIGYAYDPAGNRTSTTVTGVSAAAAKLSKKLPAPLGASMPTIKATAVASISSPEALSIGPLQLATTDTEPAIYGRNDRSDHPESSVSAVFEGDGTDRLLHIQGYAVYGPDEVGLWLNGTLLGYLSPAVAGPLGPPSLWLLPAALQSGGENLIELVPRTENQVWGVTRLGFYTLGSGIGNQDGLTGGDPSHAEGLELHMFNQGPLGDSGHSIELAWWDADSDEEIALELNGVPLGEISRNDSNGWSPVYRLRIAPESLMPGDNRLEITNRYGTSEPWSVRIDRILP